MRMNTANDMTPWFLLIGVSLVVGLIIFIFRNRSMDEANERYRNAVEAANRAVAAANHKLFQLEEALQEQNRPQENLDRILQMRKEYRDSVKDAESKRSYARSCGNAAYDAYAHGVDIQNFFLGGANDISVFSLRRRYREYRNIGYVSSLKDPTEILVLVERYVTIAMLSRSGNTVRKTERLPDKNKTEQKTEPGHPAEITKNDTNPALLPPSPVPGITLPDRQALPQKTESMPKRRSPVKRAVIALLLVVTLIVGSVYVYQRFVLGNETPFRFYPAARASVQIIIR